MYYEFSFGAFFVGLIIIIAGGAMTIYHQKLAENFGDGLASYDRYKRRGLIVCGIGLAIMLSLHTIPLNWLVNSLFGGGRF